ncbi:tetratricopeptide repeat protein [Oxobacter pfennigii]|uniref:Tetratricopeptide repeat protein n=1 Tax=Oxobacter pfennigii TaxID=36849 RepID=A0A0P8WL43_9CLOT|nr:tetratricopeptide repeat protein [Oxobacter pfennigii]KPU43098.1 tetratricopeptide repeat protein [Oxobacter pfennigii]
MKKIRIRVKHLLAIIAGILVTVIFIVPNALMTFAETIGDRDMEASKVFYKRYINLFPYGSRKDEALYNLASSLIPSESFDSRFRFYAGGMSSGGPVITDDMVQNAVNYYNQILKEYKNSKFYSLAYNNLLDLYMMSGRYKEAKELILQGSKSQNKELSIISSEYSMIYNIIDKKYNEAINTGMESIERGENDPDIHMLLGNAYLYDGNTGEALKYYKKAQDLAKWEKDNSHTELSMLSHTGSYFDKIDIINKINGGYSGSSSIEGKVTINGSPAPYVYVYLKDEKDGRLNAMGDEGSCINAVTDFEGRYIIPGLPEGNYTLGIGVSAFNIGNTVFQTTSEGYFHLKEGENKKIDFSFAKPMNVIKPEGTISPADGKVEIEWERVGGAAYYHVYLIQFEDLEKREGSYAAFSPGDKIKDTKYVMDINKVNMGTYGFMMDDDGILNPQAYIGSFYPGSLVPFYINAYDSRGKLITSSKTIKLNLKDMTAISISENSLTESDRLILERKPEEAIESYEMDLEKNPDDTHAMMVLSKLYSIGTRRKYINGQGEITEGRNIDRATELIDRLYDITGDVYYLKASLSGHFTETPEDYKRAVEGYEKIPSYYLETDDYGKMAQMYLALRDYKKAEECFDRIYDAYKDTNYFDLAPVVLSIYFEDYDKSIEFLDMLDLRLYKIDNGYMRQGILALKYENKDSEEYKRFKEALDIILSSKADKEYKNHYKDIYEYMDSPVLKDLLRQIGSYYYIFED